MSSLFDCSLCDKKNIYHSELSFQCTKKDCKRNFCKVCYPEDKGRPQCAGCSNFFCAVCVVWAECKGCGSFVCYKCIRNHEHLRLTAKGHKCYTKCFVHTFPFKDCELTKDSDEEVDKLTPAQKNGNGTGLNFFALLVQVIDDGIWWLLFVS